MNNIYTRKVVVCLFVFLMSINTVISQVSKTEYFMRTSYMRSYLNPALQPEQEYLVVPVLPNVGANIQTNTINLDHLTFKRGGERVTFLHPDVSNQDFLKGLSKNNYISTDVNYKFFALGMRIKGHYTNFDIGVRAHADVNLPKSALELLKVGFNQDNTTAYNLKNVSATATTFVEIGASQARPFLDNTLTLGARVKLLLGGGYLDLRANEFQLEASPNQWKALSQVKMEGAAPGVRPKYDSDDKLDGFEFGWDGIPGYGAGIDLGAVYDLQKVLPVLDGLKVSAALNDIGFISWTKKNSLSLYSSKTEVIIEPNEYQDKNGDKSLGDIFEDALDDFKDVINLKEKDGRSNGRSTSLRMIMLLGAEYELIKNKLSTGALYSARFGNYHTSHEMTISGNYQPFYWLGTSLSYSFVHNAFDNFGFALHLAPKKGVAFFVSSDYILPRVSKEFIPTSSKGVNVQFGFAIPIGSSLSMK